MDSVLLFFQMCKFRISNFRQLKKKFGDVQNLETRLVKERKSCCVMPRHFLSNNKIFFVWTKEITIFFILNEWKGLSNVEGTCKWNWKIFIFGGQVEYFFYLHLINLIWLESWNKTADFFESNKCIFFVLVLPLVSLAKTKSEVLFYHLIIIKTKKNLHQDNLQFAERRLGKNFN